MTGCGKSSGNALGGTANRKQVDLEFYNYTSTNRVVFHVLLYTPSAATGKVPTFLCLSFSGNYAVADDTNIIVYPVWDKKKDVLSMPKNIKRGSSHSWRIAETIARGYGIAIVDYNDIEPDLADGSGWKYGVRSLYLKPGEHRHRARFVGRDRRLGVGREPRPGLSGNRPERGPEARHHARPIASRQNGVVGGRRRTRALRWSLRVVPAKWAPRFPVAITARP